ncbi:hypothetical protein U0O11_01250 [Cobetia sp. D5]|uniref:hypothetical protein n=1 Tax=Cobetia sp. D5 TaxID=3105867 RepID=UPI002D795CD2|nr:hypothetical protein [Cobetia sp. D5]
MNMRKASPRSLWQRLGLATLLAGLLVLGGCMNQPTHAPDSRTAVIAPNSGTLTSQQVFATLLTTLAERGFIIERADPDLERLDASYAARPPLALEAWVSEVNGQIRLSVSGDSNGADIAPGRLDNLLVEVAVALDARTVPVIGAP